MLATATAVFYWHIHIQPVGTGSTRPNSAPESIVLTRSVPVDELRAGMTVVLKPLGRQTPVALRIVRMSGSTRHPVPELAGDGQRFARPWPEDLQGPIAPVVVASIPWASSAFDVVRAQTARVTTIILAGSLGCALGVRTILGPRPVSA